MPNFRIALCLVASLVGSTCHAQTLNILTWEALFADEVIAQWEARSGVSVKQIYFDQTEVRNTILLSPEVSDIDIVTIDNISTGPIGALDILVPLEQYKNTPNFRHFEKDESQRCAPYATPYLWGTLGILYRTDRVSQAPSSWRDLMQPSPELQGHIGWIENYVDTLAPALILREQAVTTDDEALLKEVFDEMKTLLPSILTFEPIYSYLATSPQADELYMALAFSSDQQVSNLISKSQHWEYVVPEEGSMIWSECLAVLKRSTKQSLAMDFLNFMNSPEVAAANSEALLIASSNAAAGPLQSEAFRNNPLVAPSAAKRAKLSHYSNDLGVRNILLRDRITSTLVELHESQ